MSGWTFPSDDYEGGYKDGREGRQAPYTAVLWPADCPYLQGYRDGQGDRDILDFISAKKHKFLSKNLRHEHQQGHLPPAKRSTTQRRCP